MPDLLLGLCFLQGTAGSGGISKGRGWMELGVPVLLPYAACVAWHFGLLVPMRLSVEISVKFLEGPFVALWYVHANTASSPPSEKKVGEAEMGEGNALGIRFCQVGNCPLGFVLMELSVSRM